MMTEMISAISMFQSYGITIIIDSQHSFENPVAAFEVKITFLDSSKAYMKNFEGFF